MGHQFQKGFCGIFVGIPQHQKENILYVTGACKIISSYHFVFDEIVSSTLAYISQTYAEAIAMHADVTHTPYDTFLRGENW